MLRNYYKFVNWVVERHDAQGKFSIEVQKFEGFQAL